MHNGIETMFVPGLKAHFQASLLEGNYFIPLYISLDILIHPGYLLLFISLSNQDSNLFIFPLNKPLFVLPLLTKSPAFSIKQRLKKTTSVRDGKDFKPYKHQHC